MYWCKCYINGQLVASEYDAYNCPRPHFYCAGQTVCNC